MSLCLSLQQFNSCPPGVFPASKVSVVTNFSQRLIALNEGEKWKSRPTIREYPIELLIKNDYHVKSSKCARSFKRKATKKNNNEINDESQADKHKGSESDAKNEKKASEVEQSSERGVGGIGTESLAESRDSKAGSLTGDNSGTKWWKFWEGFLGSKEGGNDIRRSNEETVVSKVEAKKEGNEDETAEASEFVRVTKEEQQEGPIITGAKDRKGRWTWLLGFKKNREDKKAVDPKNTDLNKGLAQEYKDLSLEWREFLDPTPENVLALTLTGLLVLSVLQIIWQLVLVAGAIIISAIKYSVLAAFLIAFIVVLL
ncbi:hypothetical protein O6H91_07G053700 [Diphasiastrum complanatum]|uniref:Uncharacterized protein n=1 Tax=Diphasiastrum complanatum TaxID=34168 RepID=A0ACC2D5B4_DIPCM|nr:hypothetical protein O6H91_07G053700 [Diphasiastrum complanatum]